MTKQNSGEMLVYIGTYTSGKSEGIYVYRMDKSTGELKFASVAKGIKNPSYLAIHPQKKYLYAVSEASNTAGKPSGAISSFSIDPKTGELTYMNQQLSHGTSPCHLTVDQTGRIVIAVNYSSGSVAVSASWRS